MKRKQAFYVAITLFLIFVFLLYPINVVLSEELTTLKVKLIDSKGRPLHNAYALLFQRGYYVDKCQSDENGIAIFHNVVTGVDTRVSVYYEGVHVGDFDVNPSLGFITLKCKVYWLTIKVLNQERDPVKHARVCLYWDVAYGKYQKSIITNEEGITELQVPCVTCRISVFKSFNSINVEVFNKTLRVTSNIVVEAICDLHVLNISIIDGRGFLVKGATASLLSDDYGFVLQEAQQNDCVSFKNIPKGRYELLVAYGGHSTSLSFYLNKSMTLTITLKGLKFGIYELRVRTLWPDGSPISHAYVELWFNGEIIDSRYTNDMGFAFFNVNPGNYTIEVSHPDAKAPVSRVITVNNDALCSVVLEYKWHHYDLLVTVKSGKMFVPNALVKVYEGDRVVAEAYTDDNGVTSLTLREGNYTISVYHENFGSKSVDVSLNSDLSVEVVLPETLASMLYGLIPYFIIAGIVVVAVVSVVMYLRYKRSEFP
ncbi:MAG: MSCRAMM family protein [Candidatus Nezhaarchaeales archaeon]